MAFSKLVLKREGEKRMEHLNVAIADDNQKILDMLENIIGMDKELNLVGKAKMVKRCVRLSKTDSRTSFFST